MRFLPVNGPSTPVPAISKPPYLLSTPYTPTEMTAKMKAGVRQANGETAVEPTMEVENVAQAVLYMAGLPLDANVLFMTVMATDMPFVGRG